MVKHILFFCVFVWATTSVFAGENKLYSPDGKLCVTVSDEGGCLLTVWYMMEQCFCRSLH